jgi:hypothetical protein
MLRRLGGCAVALALLLPAQAHAAPSSTSSPSERAGAAVTKSRTVDLGVLGRDVGDGLGLVNEENLPA